MVATVEETFHRAVVLRGVEGGGRGESKKDRGLLEKRGLFSLYESSGYSMELIRQPSTNLL